MMKFVIQYTDAISSIVDGTMTIIIFVSEIVFIKIINIENWELNIYYLKLV